MTIDAKCMVCKNPDRRRIIELGWNGGMSSAAIARQFEGVSGAAIVKHLKEHADGDGNARRVEVEPELPARERVLALQRLQLDEIERRIGLAKNRADLMNAEHENDPDWKPLDWSDFYDILDKNAQAAIASIQKTQGLTDRRDKAVADTKLGLFEAMAKNGLAPKAISGAVVPQLPPVSPDVEQDEVVEHD